MLIDTPAFWGTAAVIAISAVPIVLVGLAFLHAARAPQWVWAFANRRQIVWMVVLLGGIVVMPVGIPVALWYLVKIRPALDGIEQGRLVWAEPAGEPRRD